jgi:cytochrome c oxidase cbb3-type subunit 3
MYRHIPILILCASAFAAEDSPVVARGRAAYMSACGFCHGNDATGNRAPDLIRSTLVNHDDNGNLLGPMIKSGRPDKGMPGLPLAPQQISDIVAFLHFRVNEALSSARVPGDYPLEKLLTGDAVQGKSYFEGAGGCAGCHSPTGDLAGIAKKYSPIDLQSRFLYPQGRRQTVQRTVTVKLPSGKQFEGKLVHLDEFDVAMRDANGQYHSWPRAGVEVTIHDPLAAHRALLDKYTDADVHNLFAYLETLK